MFLRIENPVSVVPSVEMLRTLGASSARGHQEKIGQFGSGFPYSLALLARKGLLSSLKICLGKDVYTFITKGTIVKTSNNDDFSIEEIIMKKQNGGTVNLNISTEFGAVDWTDTGMAIREFISNAIDGTVEQGLASHKTIIETVEDNQCRSKDGTVRVYIKIDEDVSDYLSDIQTKFICLSAFYDPNKNVLINRENGPARIYRKGVLVGTFGEHSLFHYNTPDIPLKESRNVDSYAARERCAELLRDSSIDNVKMFIKSFEGKEVWEHNFSSYDLKAGYFNQEKTEKTWMDAFAAIHGDAILCENAMIGMMVANKGMSPLIAKGLLGEVLGRLPLKRSSDVLNKNEAEGKAIKEATNDVRACLDRVWSILENHGLTNGKSKPPVHCYSEITKAEGNTLGFYRDGEVFILSDISQACFMLTQTMLEEVAHYVTGAKDCTRDFQDFAFRIAALMIH